MTPPECHGSAPPTDAELIASARRVAEAAYSPYSGVEVGAALLAEDGRVFTGCNVENASYGLTICAERSALFQAVAAGARSFRTVAIATTSQDHPLLPCGACRQVLAELAPDLRVLAVGATGEPIEARMTELLPRAFGPDDLR